jgi:amidohydrolase
VSIDDALRDDARELGPELVVLRQQLHQQPEIGLELPITQRMVLDALDGLPLEIGVGQSTTSVTAVLRGGSTSASGGGSGDAPGATSVLLRGDMDALPIVEASGEDFTSHRPGAMHACGHDLHTAMLVGAARLLSAHRAELAGDVVFMFQPGEEGFDGAGRMLAEGVLDASGQRVVAAYGMHVNAMRRRGEFATRAGTLMAASSELTVIVRGAGGHGSKPHHAKDPISVAAQLVGDLQTMVTRRFDIFDPVVVTVGEFHAGTARNIIPDEARFEATIRTFSSVAAERAEQEVLRLCRGVAAAYDVGIDAEFRPQYPATVNDAAHVQFAESVVADVFGDERYHRMAAPVPGAEDFSRVIAAVPGCFVFLGARAEPGTDPVPDNHSPRARFSDSVLTDGTLLHAQLAIRALRAHAAAGVS